MNSRKFSKQLSLPYLSSKYPTAISGILILCSIFILIVLVLAETHKDLLPHSVALVLFLILLPFGAPYLAKKNENLGFVSKPILDEMDEKIETLIKKNKAFMFESWMSIVLPPIFGLLCAGSVAIMAGLPWGSDPYASFVYKALLVLVFTITGSIGWQFFCFEYLLFQISKLKIKGKRFRSYSNIFRQINTITVSVVVLGTIIYIVAILIVWIIPWWKTLLFSNPFGRFWAFPIAITVLLYFLIGQYFIRQIVTQSKEKRIRKIEKLIKKNHENCSLELSENNISMFSELIKWREIISKETYGLLDFQTTIMILSGILIPALGTLIDVIK